MNKVWRGIEVEPNNIDQAISRLRRELGETPRENKYIVTVPGNGYRFLAEVKVAACIQNRDGPLSPQEVKALVEKRTKGHLSLEESRALLEALTRELTDEEVEAAVNEEIIEVTREATDEEIEELMIEAKLRETLGEGYESLD